MDEKTPLVNAEVPIGKTATRPAIEHVQTTVGDSKVTINCQVCKHVVSFPARDKQMVVRCPNCSEATPIKGPPAGKQYVRCPCNCLLICSESTSRVGCPRPDCQKVIVLYEDDGLIGNRGVGNRSVLGPSTHGGTFGAPQSLRLACGNCNCPFSVSTLELSPNSRGNAFISFLSGRNATDTAGLVAARCPHCRKVTSVGPAYARVRWIIYGGLALVAIIIAISVTAGTAEAARSKTALYFLWSVLYLIALVLAIRAIMFMVMPVSSVETPTLQI